MSEVTTITATYDVAAGALQFTVIVGVPAAARIPAPYALSVGRRMPRRDR